VLLSRLSRYFILFFFFTSLLSCTGEKALCVVNDCSVMAQSEQFLRVESEEDRPRWYRFTGKDITELRGMRTGSTPLNYNEKLDLLAAKSLSGDGMRLTLYHDGDELQEAATHTFAADEISALCMTDNGTVWILHQGRYDRSSARQYIVSRGTTALKEWENYFLTSERDEDTFGGSVIEKPVGLFCTGNDVAPHLTTFLYSGEAERTLLRLPRLTLLQIYLYRFDPRERIMHPLTGFTPRGDGIVRTYFDSASGSLLLFQSGQLSLQKGLGFAEERSYPDIDDMLFAHDGNTRRLFLIGKSSDKRIVGKVEMLPE